MKSSVFLLWLLIVTVFGLSSYMRYTQHKETIQRFNQLDSIMTHRSHLDSMYWNHLEKCAFVHKDSIGIGYQGYLYSKYNRKYKIEK